MSENETTTNAPKGKGLAIAGMVIGIVAFIISFFSIGLILGIIGLVLAAIGLYQLKNSGGPIGMALTGVILNVLAIVISLYMAAQIVSALSNGGSDFMDKLKTEMEKSNQNMIDDLNDLED